MLHVAFFLFPQVKQNLRQNKFQPFGRYNIGNISIYRRKPFPRNIKRSSVAVGRIFAGIYISRAKHQQIVIRTKYAREIELVKRNPFAVKRVSEVICDIHKQLRGRRNQERD